MLDFINNVFNGNFNFLTPILPCLIGILFALVLFIIRFSMFKYQCKKHENENLRKLDSGEMEGQDN